MSSEKQVDNLTEDPIIQGQQFVCLSFVSPEGIKNCQIRALKVRGVYSSYEEAQKRAKELQEIDPDFNVFIGEVGKWLPWDPNPHEGAKDQVYYEKEMQDLVSAYKDNLSASRKEVKDRAESAKKGNKPAPPVINNDRKQKQIDKMREKLRTKIQNKENVTSAGENSNVEENSCEDISCNVDNNISKILEMQKKI
jgi:hypothetical protein